MTTFTPRTLTVFDVIVDQSDMIIAILLEVMRRTRYSLQLQNLNAVKRHARSCRRQSFGCLDVLQNAKQLARFVANVRMCLHAAHETRESSDTV